MACGAPDFCGQAPLPRGAADPRPGTLSRQARDAAAARGSDVSAMILGIGTEREALPMGETISITLAPDTLRAVRESVEAGEYASVDALLDEAVHALQRQRREDAERLDDIRARIRRSLDDPRPDLSIEEVQEDLDRMFAEARHDTRRA